MKPLQPSFSALLLVAGLVCLATTIPAQAQSRQFEFSSHFTFLDVGERTPGFGGTLTYNLARRFALESTLNFFPGDARTNLGQSLRPVIGSYKVGAALQGQLGAKAAVVRTQRAQIFLKAKPGFISFSNLRYVGSVGPNGFGNGDFSALAGRQTGFAFDVGGGAEFNPNQRTFLRFDIGDTYFRYSPFTTTLNLSGAPGFALIRFPGTYVHSFQISTGFGLRFGKSK